jgi:hypothetical protein
MTTEEFFRTDPLWNKLKSFSKIDNGKKMTRVQYLKSVGFGSYSDAGYMNYCRQWDAEDKKQKENKSASD